MTEAEAREKLSVLVPRLTDAAHPGHLDRTIQTAKQIGSAWPAPNINLIWLGYQYRIVIE